jgi:A/G-specific adenine glycosylase
MPRQKASTQDLTGVRGDALDNDSAALVSPAFVEAFRTAVLDWYAAHGREFFWRNKDGAPADAYQTFVSEVMLQQTQTSRVQEKLPTFLAQFPTIEALAAADNATIIRAWQGMGYNSRALRLRDCARAVVERHAGEIPSALEDLRALPGVGAYTASALAAFAFGQDVPVVDVNIRRVYSRVVRAMPTTLDVLPESDVERSAAVMLPRGRSSQWHQALMDIGALFCTARQPKCHSTDAACPVQHLCASGSHGSHGSHNSLRTMVEAKPQKRAEPSFRGQPNRIWRGRIVELLRAPAQASNGQASNGKASEEILDAVLSFDAILDRLFPRTMFDENCGENLSIDSSKASTEATREAALVWLMRIAEALEKDKIAEIVRSARRDDDSDDSDDSCSLRLFREVA